MLNIVFPLCGALEIGLKAWSKTKHKYIHIFFEILMENVQFSVIFRTLSPYNKLILLNAIYNGLIVIGKFIFY